MPERHLIDEAKKADPWPGLFRDVSKNHEPVCGDALKGCRLFAGEGVGTQPWVAQRPSSVVCSRAEGE